MCVCVCVKPATVFTCLFLRLSLPHILAPTPTKGVTRRAAVPGSAPAEATISCGRSQGKVSLYFACQDETSFLDKLSIYIYTTIYIYLPAYYARIIRTARLFLTSNMRPLRRIRNIRNATLKLLSLYYSLPLSLSLSV